MAVTKKILVACGTAVATSTVVAVAIEEAMKARGIKVECRQCKASEVPSLVGTSTLWSPQRPFPRTFPSRLS